MKLQLQKLVFVLLLFLNLLVLAVPFVYSYDLFNGVTNAKQIWFYLALSLILLFMAIGYFIGYQGLSFGFIAVLSLLPYCKYGTAQIVYALFASKAILAKRRYCKSIHKAVEEYGKKGR
ncbi:MAG TPA: hypothetical protein PK252_08655 [Bacteroidales bacterium]|nr:hypothetical protein [Bacteroidales bacterium]